MLLRLLALACAAVERGEAGGGVGDEGAYGEISPQKRHNIIRGLLHRVKVADHATERFALIIGRPSIFEEVRDVGYEHVDILGTLEYGPTYPATSLASLAAAVLERLFDPGVDVAFRERLKQPQDCGNVVLGDRPVAHGGPPPV